MSYIGQSPDIIVSRNSFDEFNYTATNGQTTFTGADTNNNTLAYNPGNVEVFLNGVRLEEADFTATNGTSVVLASGATTSDLLSIKAIIIFEVGDAVSKSSGGTFSNNISVTGTVTATSFSGNGGSLTGINTDLVDDTTPQLGGDLDGNSKNITNLGTINTHTIPAGTGTLALTSDIGSGDTDILTITTTSPNPAAPSSGSVNIYEDGSTLTFQNSRAGTGHYQMKMENSAGTFLFGVDGLGNAVTSSTGTMRAQYFYAVTDTSYYIAPALTSTSMAVAGKIGVGGQTSPLAKLDIKGDTSTFDGMSKIYLTDTSSNSGSRNWSLGNGGSGFGNLTFAVSAAKDGNAGDATATNAMVITSDGNVGIGQTTPGTSLHIKDAITNPNTIGSNITIPASSNSMMAGPITLNATVTVPSGSTWTIV